MFWEIFLFEKSVGKGSKIAHKVDFCHLDEFFVKSLNTYMLIFVFLQSGR